MPTAPKGKNNAPEVYSIIVYRTGAMPPDVSRGDIINIWAPWDLVEGVAKLALGRYPGSLPGFRSKVNFHRFPAACDGKQETP